MRKASLFKVIASTCSILLIVSSVNATSISDYYKQMNEIKAKQKAAAEKLTGVEKEIQENLYDIMELDEKVTEYTLNLTNLEKQKDEVNEKIKTYEEALQKSSQNYSNANDIYKTRIRVIYENGIPTFWDILFSSKGISDFFAKMNVYTSILEYDKNLLTNIQSQKEYIDYVKKDIEVQKLQLEQLTYDIAKSKETLDNAISAKEAKNTQLTQDKKNIEITQAALKKQLSDTQKELDAEIARHNASTQTFSGQFEWPLPGYNLITARMGNYDPWNTGASIKHTGTDIAGSNVSGKPIVAAESGKVFVARYYGGYGNCVMIDHGVSAIDGNSYITLYGHASALAVTQGQTVTRGQVIAYVGSTGNSTGPHLHYEIRKNKVCVDALKYYQGMSLRYL